MSAPAPVPLVDDIRDYPMHEEDDVPEGSLHRRWSGYVDDVLDARFPDCFVSGNVCIYWEPRNFRDYVAPDVFLAAGPVPDPPPRVYRSWLLPRILFAAEIGSVATAQRGAKLELYQAHLRPEEVLYTDPVDEEAGEMLTPEQVHLYRWTGTQYEPLERLPNERFWSAVLQLEIGVDEDRNLRLYTAEGEPLLYYHEAEQMRAREALARAEAELRAERLERERAEAQHRTERLEQERAQAEEARVEAERRAQEERVQREALERQSAELQARLDRGQ
jgi:hypothetical protein